MASELDELDDFMFQDYINSLNSSYFGGPGFALPDTRGGSKEPINILVDNIPNGLNRDGLVRAFKFANILPINCKLFKTNSDRHKAVVQVKTTTDAATAIQALHLKQPLNLKISITSNKGEYERKREELLREQREELKKHLTSLIKPMNRMGDLVNNLCAVENLVKILPSPDANCSACEAEPLVRHVHFIAHDQTVLDPFEGLPRSVPVSCSYCSTKEGKFVVCCQCRVVAYCGLRCQSLAWSYHRSVCSPHPKLVNGTSDKVIEKVPEKLPEKVADKAPVKLEYKAPVKVEYKAPVKVKIEEVVEKVKPTEAPVKVVKKTEEIVLNPTFSNVAQSLTPIINDNHQPRPKPNSTVNNSGFLIEEPNKIIMPKPKISLNNEVTYLRETKLNFGETIHVMVSFVENPSEFYVQRYEDGPTVEEITQILNKSCPESGEWQGVEKIKSGHYCAAKNPEDLNWYRVKVLKMEETEAIVVFIDYGNSDIIKIENLRPLPPKLSTIPTLAVCCALKFIKPLYESGWHNEASRFLENIFDDQEIPPYNHCKVINEIDGVYQVELYNDQGNALNDLLVQKGLAKHYEEIRKPITRMSRNFKHREQRESDSNAPKPTFGDFSERDNPRFNAPKNAYENEIQQYTPKHPRSIDRNEIRIENDRRIIESNHNSKPISMPKPSHPIEPVSPPRPAPKKIVSPTEAFELSRKVCPANFYHLYKMSALKSPEPVLLYMDPEDSSIVYALGDNESMLALYEGLAEISESSPKITPKPGLFGVANAEDGDYYRVLVLEMLENGKKCRVFYPDFGNQDEIDSSEIYQLPKEISIEELPAQAIRCRVDNADKIPNYFKIVEDLIKDGTPVVANVTRTISQHEYGIELKL